ncbi:MAG TPA: hypothetical protein VG367_20115 [Mucilaginibacter sp.]|jgi:hypothetical protein|nr:hypothetical protein [Mucilaginibacter sp.]
MKNKSKELDVDFIGEQDSLIKEEENQISEFIKSQKMLRGKKQVRKSGFRKKSKTIV